MAFIVSAIYISILITVTLSSSSETTRKLTAELNPDCGTTCEHYNLNDTDFNNIVHVKGDGSNDTLHFVWSTVGAPTVLIALTDKNVKMSIDWKKLFSSNSTNALTFNGEVFYAFGTIMSQLIEYNDVHKKAKYVAADAFKTYDLSNLTWKNVNESLEISSKEVKATFTTSIDSTPLLNDGSISIKMSAYGKSERMKELPHQMWTANSSLIGFTINNLKASYKRSRFIGEMIFLSWDNSGHRKHKEDIEYEVIKTIDDEYTPSVFETIDLKTPESKFGKKGGYMQFKPISYLTSNRKYKDSTAMTVNNINTTIDPEIIPWSIARSYFGDKMSSVKMANLTIKFGVASGTNFYTKYNYSTWTVAVGYGAPPNEAVSLTVILVISIGLGLPILLFIGGGLYMLVKKFKGKSNDKLVINIED